MKHIAIFPPRVITKQIEDNINNSISRSSPSEKYFRWFIDTGVIRCFPVYFYKIDSEIYSYAKYNIYDNAQLLKFLDLRKNDSIKIIDKIKESVITYYSSLEQLLFNENVAVSNSVAQELDNYLTDICKNRGWKRIKIKEARREGVAEYKRDNMILLDKIVGIIESGITKAITASYPNRLVLTQIIENIPLAHGFMQQYFKTIHQKLPKSKGERQFLEKMAKGGLYTPRPSLDHKIIAEAISYSLSEANPVFLLTGDNHFSKMIIQAQRQHNMGEFEEFMNKYFPDKQFSITVYFMSDPNEKFAAPLITPSAKMEFYNGKLTISDIRPDVDKFYAYSKYCLRKGTNHVDCQII